MRYLFELPTNNKHPINTACLKLVFEHSRSNIEIRKSTNRGQIPFFLDFQLASDLNIGEQRSQETIAGQPDILGRCLCNQDGCTNFHYCKKLTGAGWKGIDLVAGSPATR